MNLVVLYGPPAAGKLTVATALSTQTGYKLLDNHKALDYLVELFPRSEKQYDTVRSKLGRKLRLDIFEAVAQTDVNLVTTFAPVSPGAHDFMREVKEAVERNGSHICFVQLLPSREELLSRVTSESRQGKKIDNIKRWTEAVGNNATAFEIFPDVEHLVLDNTTIPAAEAAQRICEYYGLLPSTIAA